MLSFPATQSLQSAQPQKTTWKSSSCDESSAAAQEARRKEKQMGCLRKARYLLCLLFIAFHAALVAKGALLDWGQFETWGEALYMAPSCSGLGHLIEDDRKSPPEAAVAACLAHRCPVGRAVELCPGFEWGWRVGLGYVAVTTATDLRAQYTQLHTRRRMQTCAGEGRLWPAFGSSGPSRLFAAPLQAIEGAEGPPSKATARTRLDYDALRLEFGYHCLTRLTFLWLRASLGLHYTHIEHCLATTYVGTLRTNSGSGGFTLLEATVVDFRRTWGVGPAVGLDTRIFLPCALALAAQVRVAILSGNQRGKAEQSSSAVVFQNQQVCDDFDTHLSITSRNQCRLFPQIDMRLGLAYGQSVDCVTLSLEVGYELLAYVNALARPYLSRPQDPSSHCQSFLAHGVYLRLAAQI